MAPNCALDSPASDTLTRDNRGTKSRVQRGKGAVILTLNSRQIHEPTRFRNLFSYLTRRGIDIALLQESNLTYLDSKRLEAIYPIRIVIGGAPQGEKSKICIIVNKSTTQWWASEATSTPRATEVEGEGDDVPDKPFYFTDTTGRLLIATYKVKNTVLTVANVYLPAKSAERLSWLTEIRSELQGVQLPPCDFIGGDWNMIEKEVDGTSLRTPRKQETKLLKLLIGRLGHPDQVYRDGWRVRHPAQRQFSHTNSNKGSSRIDRVYISSAMLEDSYNWQMLPTGLGSDHKGLTFTLRLACTVDRGNGRWRLNASWLKIPEIQRICLEELCPTGTEPVMNHWLEYKYRIQGKITCQLKRIKRRQAKTRQALIRRIARLGLLRPRTNLRNQVDLALTDAHKRLEELEAWDTVQYTYNAMAKHYLLTERPTKWFFNLAKRRNRAINSIPFLQRGDRGPTTSVEEVLDEVKRFYADLYTQKVTEAQAESHLLESLLTRIGDDHRALLKARITKDDIAQAIKAAKTATSPGIDGLVIELYKLILRYEGSEDDDSLPEPKADVLLSILEEIFNGLLMGEIPPDAFTASVLSLLWKEKGSQNDLKNYRPLSVLNEDYKLFTSILMKRLLVALSPVIGPHQTAFLPGRLIDDNVRMVQATIEAYRVANPLRETSRLEPCNLLFIDQEKAYDRVSHEYMWKALAHIGIPEEFVLCLRNLYQSAKFKVAVNGHFTDWIEVKSGVRQGDPISCPLFLIIIEGLAYLLARNPLIAGIKLSTRTIFCQMYADDTVVFLRNLSEALAFLEDSTIFSKATGAKINWGKTFLLKLDPNSDISIPNVREINEANPYVHLGIPVGTDIDKQIVEFWKKMLRKFIAVRDAWIPFHMSMKGRVLIGNTLIMSLPRYALKFLPISDLSRKALEKAYYDLIWDDKVGHLNGSLACLPVKKGGLGCINLSSIIDASILSAINRMELRPNLPWVELTNEILCQQLCRTKTVNYGMVREPLLQSLSVRRPPPPLYMKHILDRWNNLKVCGSASGKGVLQRDVSMNLESVLSVPFWYHPDLKITKGQGAKRFSQPAMTVLAENGFERIGDIWDPMTQQLIIPDTTPEHLVDAVFKAVEGVLSDIPLEWQNILREIPMETPTIRRERTTWFLWTSEGLKQLTLLTYKEIYNLRLATVLENCNFSKKTEGPLKAFNDMVGWSPKEDKLWIATRNTSFKGKVGDLLWRLIHQKVRTGPDLTWINREKHECPIDGQPLTPTHLWIECAGAKAVWGLFVEMIGALGYKVVHTPSSLNEVIALFAFCPAKGGTKERQWYILYSTAMWCIWRSWLSFSFDDPDCTLRVDKMLQSYIIMVRDRVMMDRSTCLLGTHGSLSKEAFEECWGVSPTGVNMGKQPPFLQPHITLDRDVKRLQKHKRKHQGGSEQPDNTSRQKRRKQAQPPS